MKNKSRKTTLPALVMGSAFYQINDLLHESGALVGPGACTLEIKRAVDCVCDGQKMQLQLVLTTDTDNFIPTRK